VELLKQGQYQPLSVEKQIVSIYAGTKGYFDGVGVSQVRAFEAGLLDFVESRHASLLETIRTKKALDKDSEETLKGAIVEFAKAFGEKKN
jgi:F-type H+-transporting ATPase subunit alpha